jgi:hypothetical protein
MLELDSHSVFDSRHLPDIIDHWHEKDTSFANPCNGGSCHNFFKQFKFLNLRPCDRDSDCLDLDHDHNVDQDLSSHSRSRHLLGYHCNHHHLQS